MRLQADSKDRSVCANAQADASLRAAGHAIRGVFEVFLQMTYILDNHGLCLYNNQYKNDD